MEAETKVVKLLRSLGVKGTKVLLHRQTQDVEGRIELTLETFTIKLKALITYLYAIIREMMVEYLRAYPTKNVVFVPDVIIADKNFSPKKPFDSEAQRFIDDLVTAPRAPTSTLQDALERMEKSLSSITTSM